MHSFWQHFFAWHIQWDLIVSRASRTKEFQSKVGRADSKKRACSLGRRRCHWEDSRRWRL